MKMLRLGQVIIFYLLKTAADEFSHFCLSENVYFTFLWKAMSLSIEFQVGNFLFIKFRVRSRMDNLHTLQGILTNVISQKISVC